MVRVETPRLNQRLSWLDTKYSLLATILRATGRTMKYGAMIWSWAQAGRWQWRHRSIKECETPSTEPTVKILVPIPVCLVSRFGPRGQDKIALILTREGLTNLDLDSNRWHRHARSPGGHSRTRLLCMCKQELDLHPTEDLPPCGDVIHNLKKKEKGARAAEAAPFISTVRSRLGSSGPGMQPNPV